MHVYVGFAVLAALLLWAVIYARGPWALKLVLILSVPAYGVFVWHSVEQMRGYPVHALPPEGELVGRLIAEPEAIYLWVMSSSGEPRAYRIPYTRQAHQALVSQQQGVRVGSRFNDGRLEVYALPNALPPKEGE